MLWLIFLMPFYSDIFFSYVKKKRRRKKKQCHLCQPRTLSGRLSYRRRPLNVSEHFFSIYLRRLYIETSSLHVHFTKSIMVYHREHKTAVDCQL